MFFNLIPLEERIVLDGAMTAALGAVIYVNAAAPSGGNGDSWATAYNHLQDALNEANGTVTSEGNVISDRIWVAKGTYKPTDINKSFNVGPGTHIFGGFTGVESNRSDDASKTILSGDLLGNDSPNLSDTASRLDNSKSVVMATGTNALNGNVDLGTLKIEGGYSKPSTIINGPAFGGAITANGYLTLDNTILRHNVADAVDPIPFFSGSLLLRATATIEMLSGNLTIKNSTIKENLGKTTPSSNYFHTMDASIMSISDQTTISNSQINNNGVIAVGFGPLRQSVIRASSTGHVLSIMDSTFNANSVDLGPIIKDSEGQSSYLKNVSFTNNEGFIYDFSNSDPTGILHYDHVTIEGTTNGAYLTLMNGGHAIIENSVFQNNDSLQGIYLINSNSLEASIVKDSIFNNNNTSSAALTVSLVNTIVKGNSFINNSSLGDSGAAIQVIDQGFIDGGAWQTTIKENLFFNNKTVDQGFNFLSSGAISINTPSFENQVTVDISYNTFLQNTGVNGGAILAVGRNLQLNVNQNAFLYNNATQDGGAIALANDNSFSGYDLHVTADIRNNAFTGNTAGRYGGAVYIPGNADFNTLSVNATIKNNAFLLNDASVTGDDLYIKKTDNTVVNSKTTLSEIVNTIKQNNIFDRLDSNIIVFA